MTETKVKIGENAYVQIVWNVQSVNYSEDKEKDVATLFATKYGENYAIYCNALGYPFIEIISATMYSEVYKSISTLITEVDLFHPYDH